MLAQTSIRGRQLPCWWQGSEVRVGRLAGDLRSNRMHKLTGLAVPPCWILLLTTNLLLESYSASLCVTLNEVMVSSNSRLRLISNSSQSKSVSRIVKIYNNNNNKLIIIILKKKSLPREKKPMHNVPTHHSSPQRKWAQRYLLARVKCIPLSVGFFLSDESTSKTSTAGGSHKRDTQLRK